MARYIEADKMREDWLENGENEYVYNTNAVLDSIDAQPTADVVEVVRCGKCKHSRELDKHCEINRNAYRHCSLCRGEETIYVWHKYKKYHKNYSIVALDDYCNEGERSDT